MGVEPCGPFRDQEMIPHSDQGAIQAIVMGEGVDTGAVPLRDSAQSVAGDHLVVAPRHSLLGGKRCHPTGEGVGVGRRNEELMRTLRFGRPPAVSGIEPVESIETDFGKFGGESEIDLMIQLDETESDFVRHVQQRHAVVFGTRDDVAYREPARHVGPCLSGHLERPEVERLSVSSVVSERPSKVAFSPVVRGDREQPIPVEVPVELLQVVESGRGGRYEVPPAVIPPVDSKTVQPGGGGDELPEPRSPRGRIGEGPKRALDHGQQRELERKAPAFRLANDVGEVVTRAFRHPIEVVMVAPEPVCLTLDSTRMGPGDGELAAHSSPDVGIAGQHLSLDLVRHGLALSMPSLSVS